MHCYSCDRSLTNGEGFDPPTGRFYCGECFQCTIDEQLRLASLEEYCAEGAFTSIFGTQDEPDSLMKAILDLTSGEEILDIISLESFREIQEEESYD